MKQAICDQAKMKLRNKPWLDQPSEHHKGSDHSAHSHLE